MNFLKMGFIAIEETLGPNTDVGVRSSLMSHPVRTQQPDGASRGRSDHDRHHAGNDRE